jgi:hypothetical protein
MNIRLGKSQVLILAAGIIAIVTFSIYNFMDSITSNSPDVGTRIAPVGSAAFVSSPATESLDANNSSSRGAINNYNNSTAKQNAQETNSSSANSTSTNTNNMLSLFENRDKRENYYSIEFPAPATVVHGDKAGSYVAKIKDGVVASSRLQDIPDDTNVQLYILTHDEPQLRLALKDYGQLSFNQLTVGQHRAWNLVYTWKNGTSDIESSRTYVEGPDEAMVIEFNAPAQVFTKNEPLMTAVRDSFNWIG